MNELAARLASLCTGKTSEISLSYPLWCNRNYGHVLVNLINLSAPSTLIFKKIYLEFSSYNRWDGCTNLVE